MFNIISYLAIIHILTYSAEPTRLRNFLAYPVYKPLLYTFSINTLHSPHSSLINTLNFTPLKLQGCITNLS